MTIFFYLAIYPSLTFKRFAYQQKVSDLFQSNPTFKRFANTTFAKILLVRLWWKLPQSYRLRIQSLLSATAFEYGDKFIIL